MRIQRRFQLPAAVLGCLGLILPLDSCFASGPARGPAPSLVRDIGLAPGGRLTGQLMDVDGAAVVGRVAVQRPSGEIVAHVESDAQGRFLVTGLSGGVYVVSTDQAAAVCRCWVHRTAPPSASDQLLLVADGRIARGQRPLAEALFSAPVLVGLIIVAAVAIPVAINNSKSDAS